MHKVAAVEEAKTKLEEAKEWGVFKWLTDKNKMRAAADNAWVALEEVEEKIKSSWSDDLQKAFAELGGGAKKKGGKAGKVDPAVKALAEKLKEADEEAAAVRQAAEDMFVEAEKRMSTSMARDAAQKAIDAYAAREKTLRKFEAAARGK